MTSFGVVRVDAMLVGHGVSANSDAVRSVWFGQLNGIAKSDKGQKEKGELHL